MIALEPYDDLLHEIYESALESAHWPTTIEKIARYFDASRAVIFTFMHGPDAGGFAFTYNISQAVLEAWAAVSQDEDPFVQAVLKRGLLVDGATFDGGELVPRETLLGTRFYRQVWAAWDIDQLCVSIVFDGSDGHKLPTSMSLYRATGGAPFTRAEVDLVRRLCVHLSRALGVMFHLRGKERQMATSRAALDRLSSGIVLLDAESRITFTNGAARRILAAGTSVRQVEALDRTSRARLETVAQTARIDLSFRKALSDATTFVPTVSDDPGEHFSHAVVFVDREGRPSCIAHTAPLFSTALAFGGEADARAIVILYDLRGSVQVAPGLLQNLFGMTPAEARAARQVSVGGTAEEMAARLNVSINTFKSQLKAAYAKTNTNRQVDLLKLLLALGSET